LARISQALYKREKASQKLKNEQSEISSNNLLGKSFVEQNFCVEFSY